MGFAGAARSGGRLLPDALRHHWCRLREGLTAEALNQRLFKRGAAILKGVDCDMARRGDASPLRSFFRFSFGPLKPDSFDADIAILKEALAG